MTWHDFVNMIEGAFNSGVGQIVIFIIAVIALIIYLKRKNITPHGETVQDKRTWSQRILFRNRPRVQTSSYKAPTYKSGSGSSSSRFGGGSSGGAGSSSSF